MSADQLRKAAAKLRENAHAIAHFGHAWTLRPDGDGGWQILYVENSPDAGLLATIPDYAGMEVADWFTLMSPALAEPLAAWLDQVAAHWPPVTVFTSTPQANRERSYARNIGRLILGEETADVG